MTLPRAFLDRPLAHRGYHDAAAGRVENSLSAFEAAIDSGYGIELDVQFGRDPVPMVFHDATLDRLTGLQGPVRNRAWDELTGIGLLGGADTIPRLDEVLGFVAGRVPVLIEVKDQDGYEYPFDPAGVVGRVVRNALSDVPADIAVMSFNPDYVATLSRFGGFACGITSTHADDYPAHLPGEARERLARLEDFDRTGASFISHNLVDLDNPKVRTLRARGVAVLCWTIRSQAQADAALRIADNITFEGFAPA